MNALIAFLVNSIRAMLFVHAAKFVVGILGFFGLAVFTQKVAVGPLVSQIQSMMATGPSGEFGAVAMQWMGILRLDQAISMMLSAFLIVQTIKGAKTFLGKVSP